MLAKNVNDNAGCLSPCGVQMSIASMLAPTGNAKGPLPRIASDNHSAPTR